MAVKKCLKCKEPIDYTERNGLKTYKHKFGYCLKNGCLNDYYLNNSKGQEKLRKATIKATKPRIELRQAKQDYKTEKSLPKEIKLTQIAFNKFIRIRDIGKPCISSNVFWRKDFDAGHLFSVKQYSALRFNEYNCHAQSIGDNRFKEGNFEDYLINVKHRIGDEKLNQLMKLAEETKREIKKWTIIELQEIRKIYNKKHKDLLNSK